MPKQSCELGIPKIRRCKRKWKNYSICQAMALQDRLGRPMKRFGIITSMVVVFANFGIAQAEDQSKAYQDLYQILDQSAATPEKIGCANRAPFSDGYICGPNEPAFSFKHGTLSAFVDGVQVARSNSVVHDVIFFSPNECMNFEEFHQYLSRSSEHKSIKHLRSFDVSASDGGVSGVADEFKFRSAQISIVHKYATESSCILSIDIKKDD